MFVWGRGGGGLHVKFVGERGRERRRMRERERLLIKLHVESNLLGVPCSYWW